MAKYMITTLISTPALLPHFHLDFKPKCPRVGTFRVRTYGQAYGCGACMPPLMVSAPTIQASAQAAFKPGEPGADVQPDLSHLTPEERRIIEDVISRQRQEELIDRSQGTIPPPVVQSVHRGSKVFQRLPTLPDAAFSSALTGASSAASTTNAQAVKSLGRAKDEFFGGVTRRSRLNTERPFPHVQHNRTSEDLFGAVSNFFTRTGGGPSDGDVCEICHVTKFTSTAGHNCAQCGLKTCVRCGGWFGTQSSWMCKNCFSDLSSPQPIISGGVKDAQKPTTNLAAISAAAGEVSSHSRRNPQSFPLSMASTSTAHATSSSSTTSTVPPSVDRSQSGYAGVASRTRLREAMRDHRSVSEEEPEWSHYQPTPSSHTHPLQHHGRQPPSMPPNYYSRPQTQPHPMRQQPYAAVGVSTMSPRYLQQHSSHYPPSITYSQPPPPPQLRHSTGPTVGSRAYRGGRGFAGEGVWTHPAFPPPLKPPEGGVGASTVSCFSAEGSPRTGFYDTHRRSGGGQIDPGSVSEPCQSETFLRGDPQKSFTAESRMYQRSIDVDRPFSSRSVVWSASQDGESLIGQVYIRKARTSSEIGLLSSFGLKLVIGKRVPSDMVGTFVSSVKEGSAADVMGELQTGDEILEWNGHNLRGLHQEEVSKILALSRNTDEVWLTVQRVLDDYYEELNGAAAASFLRRDDDPKFQDEEEEEEEQEEEEEYGEFVGRGDADPHLQLKLRYDEGKQVLVVSVLAARDLPPQLNTETWLCNSFCQITILPEMSKYESRCTRVARNTNDPVWIQNFSFDDFVVNAKELEVAVFDYQQGQTAFIGEVLINLQVADLSGRAYWYPIPPPWDTTDQEIASQVQSESGTFEADDWGGEASDRLEPHRITPRSSGRSLRDISPRSVPSQLSSSVRQRHRQIGSGSRTSRKETRAPAQPAPPRTHPTDRGARFTLSEDDQSFLSDNSEASEFSSFSKLSLQSSRLRQRQRQGLNTGSTKVSSSKRRVSPRISRSRPDCRSPQQDLLAEAGEEDENAEGGEVLEPIQTNPDIGRGKSDRGKEERSPDDQPKSSSAEEKSASSSTAAGVSKVATSIASATSTGGSADTAPTPKAPKSPAASSSSTAARKRRSSIHHKFSNVLGRSKKNTAISGADKKTKASFQRSEEVIPANIHTNEKGTVSGGYKAPGTVAEGAGFGGIAASSAQSTGGAGGSHHGGGFQHQLGMSLDLPGGANRKDQLALDVGEVHVGEFVDGLGPGQLVGRQVLGMPCLGEIQLSFFDRKGHLEVEVIRARGLQQKNTSKPLPTPYVKLHLLEGKQTVEKMRTTVPSRRTLDPLFQQQFSFSNSHKDKILQVSVWGEYGRMDKKVFLGMCEIVLDDLNLRSIVFGWYKLFGMIAATAQHHKPLRRHTSGGSSANPSSSAAAAKRRASKGRQSRGKS
ncbi:hypothetical protein Aperf_G00000077011 [Anoplocephala perfoliata]